MLQHAAEIDLDIDPIGPELKHFGRFTPAAMRARLRELYEERPDVEVLRHLTDLKGMLSWAQSVGVCTDPQLAALTAPIAPLEIRQITAASDPAMFLYTGWHDLMCFLTIHGRRTVLSRDPVRVLDFGCGGGRLLRYFVPVTDHWDAVGVEVNRAMATWCDSALAGTRTLHISTEPPIPLPDRSFDFIYSFSVFSHLDDASATAWRHELTRLLEPGGLLVVTKHGIPSLRWIQRSPRHQHEFGIEPEHAAEIEAQILADGSAFVPYPRHAQLTTEVGAHYGNTFITADHVHRRWPSDELEILAHRQGGLRSHDIIVARRRL
jgi:SAM-dependent methyltransferase